MKTQLLFQEHLALGIQHVFDHVSKHLLTQMKRSETYLPNGSGLTQCLYRGPDNTSCAVGCLIANREYKVQYENKSIDWLQQQNKEFVINDGIILNLLGQLQCLHDSLEVENWKESLKNLSTEFNLVWNQDLYPTDVKSV